MRGGVWHAGSEARILGSTTSVLMLLAIALIYMLPTIIAFAREHRRRQDVVVANVIFGWTLIGWIVVFLWASFAATEDEPA